MTNPGDPAFGDAKAHRDSDKQIIWIEPIGLTKREYFAAMAMQGFCAADQEADWGAGSIAKYAVEQADALIAELNK